MKDLSKYYPFRLTDEQNRLINELLDFFESDDEVFILKGFAGTGKTSLMLGLVKYLGENHKPFMLMASTGRAAKVLSEKAGYPASTIHSSIYVLQIVETGRKGSGDDEISYRVTFKQKQPNPIRSTIYFVDESSMLSNRLQQSGNFTFGSGYLLNDFFSYKGPGKVVFIGDPAQLPPVNAKFSAALSKNYFANNFDIGIREFSLKQVMRYHNNSGMYYNTNNLRAIIQTKRFPPLSIKASGFDDMEVYYHENDLVKSYYHTIQKTGIDSTIYITFTNKAAASVNRKVRVHLWGQNKVSQLQVNESLMVARNNYMYGLNNGDLVTVDSIDDHKERKAGLVFKKITVRYFDPQQGSVLKNVMIISDLLDIPGRDLSLEQDMELLRNYFGRMHKAAGEIYALYLSVQNGDETEGKIKIDKWAHKNNIKVNTDLIFEKQLSKKKLAKMIAYDNMQTDPYLNALRVKYGYAITCHKAQGSEWQQVFIHFERSLSYLDREALYRWAYTAISRAEKKLHLLNSHYLY
jgi:hypothetical protein